MCNMTGKTCYLCMTGDHTCQAGVLKVCAASRMDWDVVKDCTAEGQVCDDVTDQCITPPEE